MQKMYEGYGNHGNDFYFERIDGEVTANFDSYLHGCRQYCRSGSRSLRMLDVGCGNGSLLERASRQGFECEGIETCQELAELTRNKLNRPVHNKLLAHCGFPMETFDVITMYDLIEHLPDPIEDLRLAQSWLKPGGILFVLTPNDDALIRRVARLAYRTSLRSVQRPMQTLYYPHHLSYFTARSLRSLFENVGLDIVHMETRNQEMSRLNVSGIDRLMVNLVFAASRPLKGSRGKLVAWARRRP
jgi:2-polyprenyl-3-methyl-5-hydroxy-6-metoxy-1,4-benzoquinol methylase